VNPTEPLHFAGATRLNILCQACRIFPILAGIGSLVVVAGLVLIYVHYRTPVNPLVLLVDPFAEVGLPAYTGVYTNVGILLWCASAVVWFFSAALLWQQPGTASLRCMFTSLGLFSAVLCLDDMFLLHEELGLRLAMAFNLTATPHARSVLEAPMFVAYAALGACIVLRYWDAIRRTDYLLLASATISLAASIVIDVGIYALPSEFDRWLYVADIAEDLLKLGGILFWFAYAARTGFLSVRQAMSELAPRLA